MRLHDYAKGYLSIGLSPIPVPHKKKCPVISGWPDLRITEATLPQYFPDDKLNIGILLGDPSKGLVDIDLDCSEAVITAREYLSPLDTRVFGRPGNPSSHYLCFAPGTASKKYQRDGKTLMELRSTGLQTLVPPSVHPSGESITFANKALIRPAPAKELETLVARIAAASLLARVWGSADGARHDATLALAGGLLSAGWPEEACTMFIQAVTKAAGDAEAKDRLRAVQDTFRKDREKLTGWPRLVEILSAEVVSTLRAWLSKRPGPDSIGVYPYKLGNRRRS
jgi:hypothetical protein